MPYGYNGKILRVNLSEGTTSIDERDEVFYRTYLGGKGIGSYYLLNELKRGVDALSPENKLIFAASVITGAPAPAICRYCIVSKSPLTGGYAESEAGGWWGPALKMAGFDAIVCDGKADKLTYIFIDDGKVLFKDAGHLKGLSTGDTEAALRRDLGSKGIRVLSIGPAGENLVRFACVSNDLVHVNGRCGLGAVMGSKNLKAIAIRGTQSIKMKDPEAVRQIAGWFARNFKDNPLTKSLYDHGTHPGVGKLNVTGLLPTRNFHSGEFELSENINCETFEGKYSVTKKGCFACPMRCKKIYADQTYGSPEYETVAAFGSNLGVSDLDTVLNANVLCNKRGLDTIGTGIVIAFAMECVEKRMLEAKDFDGVDVRFGNEKSVLPLIEMIASRKGMGNLLAEGTKRAADKIGQGSADFAMHVKGQEIALHDPRGKFAFGLGMAVSATGGEHNVMGPHDSVYEMKDSPSLKAIAPLGILEPMDALDTSAKKVRLLLYGENFASFLNALSVCNFGPVPRGVLPLNKLVDLVKGITGFETSLWELMKAGERCIFLTRCFNVREGFSKEDDYLPKRFFEPIEGGRLKGKKMEKDRFEEALITYYRMRGYDSEGRPIREKLQELNIEWAWDRMTS
jgi:aldehyde:ferredoxin oxidoreductase